jgi:hypothetical protein
MPGLLETRLHVAKRMREIAARSGDPSEIRAAMAYAEELERAAGIELLPFMAYDHQGPRTRQRDAKASKASRTSA